MKHYEHPELEDVELAAIMHALSDPWRIGIVRSLMVSEGVALPCNAFPMDVSKATRSHHFDVLRGAGLIQSRMEGTKCMTSLRRKEIDAKFPGLLALVRKAE